MLKSCLVCSKNFETNSIKKLCCTKECSFQNKKNYRKKHKEKNIERSRQWRLNNPERYKLKQKEYAKNNKDNRKISKKIWRDKNPDKVKNSKIKRVYGITIEKYNEMLVEQNGLCKICKKPEITKLKNKINGLAIDHCHKTGKIRSLLCLKCNSALGKFNDSIDLLQEAINYLKEFK